MIERVKGNLLDAEVEALVNTVNTVGVMGKGVALQFKNAFPANYAAYKKACESEQVQPGHMFIHDLGGLGKPRYIINFPTKRHWKGKSKLVDIHAGLTALVGDILRLGIRSIALPPLGCGHGGLNWNDVYPMIEHAFSALPEVRVLVFDPAGAPSPEQMKVATPRPNMTAGRAAVLGLMGRYQFPGSDYLLSLLEVHKLAYFLQVAGHSLKLEFKKETYGPYADTLRHVLKHIEGHFIRGFGDGQNKPDTPIRLLPEAVQESEAYLTAHPELHGPFKRVVKLIDGFETPYGMELLSSVHWIATSEAGISANDDSMIVAGVHNWNPRKRELMKPEHIKIALNRLREQGWI